MGHIHNVYDADIHFLIDSITRVVKNQATQKIRLIQGDHNSEVFSFSMPRYIEGHDMTQCTEVEIHYNNTDATSKEKQSKGVYEVKDLQIDKDDAEKVVFSWTIKDNATVFAGTLNFLIKFKCVSNGAVDYKWHTDINSEISVSTGMDNGETVTEPFPDILAQWKAEIFGDAENAVANINLAEKNALEAVQTEGATQIQAIKTEGETQVENVRTAAEAIEASRNQIHLNNALKASVIEGSAEGEVIVLNDSAEQPFGMFHLFGKSEQFKTTGKNLLNIEEDCTFEGYLIISANIPAGSYILSLESLERGGDYQPYVHFVDNNVGTYLYSATKEAKITLSQDEKEVRIYSNNFSASGSAGVSATLQRLMLSSEGGDYEPFTGCIPSPNPEYPQKINSVENPEVLVRGKNFAKSNRDGQITSSNITVTQIKDSSDLVITGTASNATSITVIRDIPIAKGRYVVSVEGLNVIDKSYDRIYVTDADGNLLVNYVRTGEPQAFDVTKYTEVSVTIIFAAGSTYNDKTINVQIELGDSKTSYEPYKGQVLFLPHTLHGIPVTSGGNYTDTDGRQWICDELDLERGVLVQRIKEFVLSELNPDTWYTWGVNHTTEGITGFYHYYTDEVLMDFVLCNIGVYGSKTWGGLSVGVGSSAASKYFTISVDNSVLADTSTNEKAIESFKTLITDTNAKIYAVIEPIETALSEDEIEAFKAIVTNYPNTTILNNCGANMAVRYGIDTKTYIDKKFEELKASLTA